MKQLSCVARLAIVLATMVMVLGAMGCFGSYPLEVGFRNFSNHEIAYGPTHAGIRSRQTTFDINEVVLEFHFGHFNLSSRVRETADHDNGIRAKSEIVSVALFITRGFIFESRHYFADFRNISDRVHFIREIPPDEFFTPNFEVGRRRGWPSGYTFAHSEQILVPSSILFLNEAQQGGGFTFRVVLVTQNEEGYYNLSLHGYDPSIIFTLLENNQVRLRTQ